MYVVPLWSVIVGAFFLSATTKAFVKIDVSKLSTTTVAQSDTTIATTLVTGQQNVTSNPTTVVTTTMPTTIAPTNATVNSTSNTELNQTSEVNVTRPSLDDHVPRTSRVKISPDHYYCPCDLMVNFCDINCCCDNDCTDDMLKVFVCDEKHWSIYDFEYDAGLTSCAVRNDLFCVVGKEAISETVDYDASLFGERSTHRWPTMFASYESNDEHRENYKSGDAVLAFDDKTEEIGKFGENSSGSDQSEKSKTFFSFQQFRTHSPAITATPTFPSNIWTTMNRSV